jgi:hypothetical protein
MGFSRPQLVAVSDLFRWESLDGWDFLGHNLLLSQASLFTMESWLSRSLSHELFFFFYDGILAITKPFSRTFFFFHDGIVAITKPFSRTFFFFHDGIVAITKSFSRTFFLSSRWNSGYHEAFLTNFFSFFTMEFWLSRSLSHELFSSFTMEFSRYTIWGKTLFIYISQRVFT